MCSVNYVGISKLESKNGSSLLISMHSRACARVVFIGSRARRLRNFKGLRFYWLWMEMSRFEDFTGRYIDKMNGAMSELEGVGFTWRKRKSTGSKTKFLRSGKYVWLLYFRW